MFISFLSPQITQLEQQGKIFNQMAAISTNTACAPVTSHSRGNNVQYAINAFLLTKQK